MTILAIISFILALGETHINGLLGAAIQITWTSFWLMVCLLLIKCRGYNKC